MFCVAVGSSSTPVARHIFWEGVGERLRLYKISFFIGAKIDITIKFIVDRSTSV